jgi:UDP-N-acetylmuramoylalanine--D-glutamate ligase
VVLNLEDASSRQLAMALPPQTRIDWFGKEQAVANAPLVPLEQVGELPGLVGRHNRINAQAALTVISALGLANDLPANPWEGFTGLAHRLQPVARANGVAWLNDSKATNVGATLAAVEGLAGDDASRIVLIVGGDGKGQEFAELQRLTPYLRALVVIGSDGNRIAELFEGQIPVLQAANMMEVVAVAAQAAQEGDAVLLSPACASQDEYRDYQQRGEQFVAAVNGYLGGGDR